MEEKTNRMFRKLDAEDLRRMNLPEALWDAKLKGVPEAHQKALENFLKKIHDALAKGVGVFLFGAPGVGKSCMASIVLKYARSWGYSGYFTSFWELRENIRTDAIYDDTDSVFNRAKRVDVLVMDDLRNEDRTEKYYLPMRAVEELIKHRANRKKMTIVTTSLQKNEFVSINGLTDVLSGFIKIEVKGEDLRAKNAAELHKDFLGTKGQ